ncbi:MAG: hypothetical protein JSS51_01385 [Planctomycetes bacterium]|nr:hypothetical protein [Planctomycetota bacterium]
MSATAMGAFFRLAAFAWNNTPPNTIPNDPPLLAKIARAENPAEWRDAWAILKLVFVPDPADPQRLVNPTAQLSYARKAAKAAIDKSPRVSTRGPLLAAPPAADPAKPFKPLIEEWASNMRVLGKRPQTIASFTRVVSSTVNALGWKCPEDIMGLQLEDHLVKKVESGQWCGATLNREIACFRSFFRFLRKRQLINADPVENIVKAATENGPGARAGTIEEGRKLLAHIASRMNAERRGPQNGNRLLQTLALFQAGMRSGEPEKLQWGRHIVLDDEVPHFNWTSDIQKNRHAAIVAMHPELERALRRHREEMRAFAQHTPAVIVYNRRRGNAGEPKRRLINPDSPGSFVFPWASSAAQFRKDSDRAGIPKLDARGRSFSPHSARKYFQNGLRAAGVHGKLIDYLMRHHVDACSRYDDPTLTEQRAAIVLLPTLLPMSTTEATT